MKRSFVVPAIAAAVLSLSVVAPAQAGVVGPMTAPVDAQTADSLVEKVGRRGRRRWRRGVAIGAGLVTLGIIGALAADRAHSRPRDYYDDDDGHGRCRRWRRRCNRGNDRACWKFDTRC